MISVEMNNQFNGASERLEDAFQLFNKFSEKLTDSYSDLESQVVQLTKELAEARSERLIQLAEKEVLAKRLAGLLDVLPAGIVVLDSNGSITQTNPLAREMLGLQYDSDTLNGKQWENIALDMFVTIGDELQLKDGRWVSVSACPLKDDPGKIILISDVSETHILQNMLSRQQRLSSLGEMIASLAHQIRTPLSSALLYLSTMRHPMSDDSKKRCYAEKARERLLHLERMVDDMLLFARGDVSKYEHVDAAKLFRQLGNILKHDQKCQHITFDINTNLENIVLRANADILLSAIQNIIDNAIEACADLAETKAVIEIRAFLNDKNMLEVSILDNGYGMSETTNERAFEPFFTTRSNGTGLGLAVVNATVSHYGGNITINSAPGKGCEIKIILPHTEVAGMLSSSLQNAANQIKHVNSQAAFSQHSNKANLKLVDCREV